MTERRQRERRRTPNGLCCPECGAWQVVVTNSRGIDNGQRVKRRRKCLECDTRFTAYEQIDVNSVTPTTRGVA